MGVTDRQHIFVNHHLLLTAINARFRNLLMGKHCIDKGGSWHLGTTGYSSKVRNNLKN